MLNVEVRKKLLFAEGEMMLDVAMQLAAGELVALTGPSGSGKTTLLRMIAGLAKPEQGHIAFAVKVWFDQQKKINLPPQRRNVGIVFQEYALFPNMTVRKNLAYAMQPGHDPSIVEELIRIMELEALTDRYPNTLSGGQQQRVALARALVNQPGVLLLDEPLSALDTRTRMRLQDYILKLHQKFNLTIILVSHDVREIVKMANRVFTLREGKISEARLPEALPKFPIGALTGHVVQIIENENGYVAEVFVSNSLTQVPLSAAESASLLRSDIELHVRKS